MVNETINWKVSIKQWKGVNFDNSAQTLDQFKFRGGRKIWKALIKIKVKVRDKIGKTSEINNERLFQED